MAAWRRPTSRGNYDGAVEKGGGAKEIVRRTRGVRRRATGLGAGGGVSVRGNRRREVESTRFVRFGSDE